MLRTRVHIIIFSYCGQWRFISPNVGRQVGCEWKNDLSCSDWPGPGQLLREGEKGLHDSELFSLTLLYLFYSRKMKCKTRLETFSCEVKEPKWKPFIVWTQPWPSHDWSCAMQHKLTLHGDGGWWWFHHCRPRSAMSTHRYPDDGQRWP